jgi:hypothetical protein
MITTCSIELLGIAAPCREDSQPQLAPMMRHREPLCNRTEGADRRVYTDRRTGR